MTNPYSFPGMPPGSLYKPIFEKTIIILKEMMGVEYKYFFTPCRRYEVCIYRQLVCYVLQEKFNLKLEVIGKFINRDHSTVIYNRQRFKEILNLPGYDQVRATEMLEEFVKYTTLKG